MKIISSDWIARRLLMFVGWFALSAKTSKGWSVKCMDPDIRRDTRSVCHILPWYAWLPWLPWPAEGLNHKNHQVMEITQFWGLVIYKLSIYNTYLELFCLSLQYFFWEKSSYHLQEMFYLVFALWSTSDWFAFGKWLWF